jgi:hypothetical protein
MELPHNSNGLPEIEPTPSREALRLIVEVFRDGHRAASDLRGSAARLTPGQLQVELEAIEESMLAQISQICERCDLHGFRLRQN